MCKQVVVVWSHDVLLGKEENGSPGLILQWYNSIELQSNLFYLYRYWHTFYRLYYCNSVM